ncbi:MAG: DUF1934 domain-containing protein [Eubacteriales bacterium]|nr:DUF1934 domain-containing protein [Eubacteriales bacterium]
MTKDVLVRIRGLQMMAEDQDEMEIILPGSYLIKDGRHYIRYEEAVEGAEGTIQNLIKIDASSMEVTKRGLTNVRMVFEKDKKHQTYYGTPYGDIPIGIHVKHMEMEHEENRLRVTVDYALEMNDEHQADCTIHMEVQSKEDQDFRLS